MAEIITTLGKFQVFVYRLLYTERVADRDKETKGKVEPVFITIDPERDGPVQVTFERHYVGLAFWCLLIASRILSTLLCLVWWNAAQGIPC